MFALMHMDRNYGQMMEQVMTQSQQMTGQLFPQDSMSAAQKQEYADFMRRVRSTVTASFSWQILEPGFAEIYAKQFTDAELDAFIAFYQSPAGQAMIAKTPEVLKQGQALSAEHMQILMPQLQSMMKEEMARMAAAARPPVSSGAKSN